MFWDRLSFYGMPAAATVALHLMLVAVLTFNWPETKTIIAAVAKPKVIQAALVDANTIRPKKTSAARSSRPAPAAKKPDPKPSKSRPAPVKPDPVSVKEQALPSEAPKRSGPPELHLSPRRKAGLRCGRDAAWKAG